MYFKNHALSANILYTYFILRQLEYNYQTLKTQKDINENKRSWNH